jgi:hypothetical protein
MKLDEYRDQVASIPFGKRLPGAVYVHRDAGGDFGAPLNALVAMPCSARIGDAFNFEG